MHVDRANLTLSCLAFIFEFSVRDCVPVAGETGNRTLHACCIYMYTYMHVLVHVRSAAVRTACNST